MNALTHIVVWLNAVANAFGQLFAPIGFLPGWLGATIVAIVTGIGMLLVFKHTSNQRAITNTRRSIRANLLAAKLFKDNIRVGLRAQVSVLIGAGRLLLLGVVPMLVLMVPTLLLLVQLALWYQLRPLPVGEESVVTLKLDGPPDSAMPVVILVSNSAIEDQSGPVRVLSEREVCWSIRAREKGYHRLQFQVDGQTIEKEIAVGDGFMRVSARRPVWNWSDAFMYPRERTFDRDSPVQSIEIEYPERTGWITGADNWVFYWFAVSLISGLALRKVFNVNL
jgi:hypothetical protein